MRSEEGGVLSEVDPVSGTRLEPFITAGIATRPEQTLLADRAADYLRADPPTRAR